MKIKYFLLLLIILTSCKDDISNKNFRNENYVFYQENGKAGKWLKINPDLEIKLPKSHSTYFFPNGNRFAELKVIDSFPNRILKFYNKDDILIRTVKFKSDSMVSRVFENGYYNDYHSNLGLLQSEGLIENHMYQGKWKFYRNDGETIKQIVEYVNDTLHGIREDYWENGNLQSKLTNVNGKQNGKAHHYYETGELEEINHLKNGRLDGSMKSYYKNGNVEYTRNYWNDKKVDTCKSFFENGGLKNLQIIQIDTISGITTGKEFKYYESGELHKKAEIKNNLPNGIITTYYKNGNIKSLQEVTANKINGKFVSFYENGQKKQEAYAINNIFQDSVYDFKKNGSLYKTTIFESGIIIDSIIH